MGLRGGRPVDPAGAPAHGAAAGPRRVNPIRRMMGSIVAELCRAAISPRHVDMDDARPRPDPHPHDGRSALVDLAGCCPRRTASWMSSCRPSPRPTVRTLSAPVRVIRQARRFDTRDWTRDPRFATFDREVAELALRRPYRSAGPDLVGRPGPRAHIARRAHRPAGRLPPARRSESAEASAAARRARPPPRGRAALPWDPHSHGRRERRTRRPRASGVASRPTRAAFRASDPADFERRVDADEAFAHLRQPVAAYLAEYGHREVRSAFLMSEPTWGEVPALLYAGIAGFIDHPGGRPSRRRDIAAAAAERLRGRRRVRTHPFGRRDPRCRRGGAGRHRVPRGHPFPRAARAPALRAAMLEAGRRTRRGGSAGRSGGRAPPHSWRARRIPRPRSRPTLRSEAR